MHRENLTEIPDLVPSWIKITGDKKMAYRFYR
jgi:hypothetical protein